MNKFKSLVLMQLKDKLDFSYLKSRKKTIFKVVFSVVKFVVITGIIFLVFYLLSYLRLLSLLPGIPINVLTVIFTVMFILSIIVCTNGLKKNLYQSKDNFMLLTFPIGRSALFLSKIVVFYLYEFVKNIYYFLPVLISYSIINACPFYYYIWILISIIIYTLLVVTISAILSIPALYISTAIKSKKWIDLTLVATTIALAVFILIKLILSIPDNFDLMGNWGTTFWNIQDFLQKFTSNFYVFKFILIALIGDRYGVANLLFNGRHLLYLFALLTITILLMTLTYFIIKPIYFKMSSKNFEFEKKFTSLKLNYVKLNSLISGIKKEIILNYRTSEKFYSLVFISIGLPLSILLLNKIYSAMDTRLTGTYMSIAFNILLILLIILSSNTLIARSYSEEGTSSYLIKTNPQPYILSLTVKFIINAIIYSISLFITIIIFSTFVKLGVTNTILIYLLCECLYIGHLLYSAELDILNPLNLDYSTTGNSINNKNESKSSLFAIIISAIFAFLSYFFISENPNSVWLKLFLIALVYLILRIYLYISKIKIYYKET